MLAISISESVEVLGFLTTVIMLVGGVISWVFKVALGRGLQKLDDKINGEMRLKIAEFYRVKEECEKEFESSIESIKENSRKNREDTLQQLQKISLSIAEDRSDTLKAIHAASTENRKEILRECDDKYARRGNNNG